MLAKFNTYKTVKPYSFSTANNVASYPFPPGLVTIEGGYITVGSVNFPLKPIQSRYNDLVLRAIQIQASALPQFYFVEQDSFKIWPTPQQAYTGEIFYHFRDRNLSVEDFTGGTISLSNGSEIVTNDTGIFTPAMVGRWFTVTDPTVAGQGYWYRITGYTDNKHLTLGTSSGVATPWAYSTASTSSYIIGESPELPEEAHMTLVDGVTAGFYAHMRKDPDNAARYDNLFWTGDISNSNREIGNSKIAGGVIGMINRYSSRDDTRVINRRPRMNPLQYKVWATSLS